MTEQPPLNAISSAGSSETRPDADSGGRRFDCHHRRPTNGYGFNGLAKSGDIGNSGPGTEVDSSLAGSLHTYDFLRPQLKSSDVPKAVSTLPAHALGSNFHSQEAAEFGMDIRDGAVEAIGHTPLIKLEAASAATGCTILGKAEFMNPGGSVKDRAGRQMILEAEKRGELKPGGLVVEATAGNTGIGLALVANARGYRTVIVIPKTQSHEKKDTLRLFGAELVEVPALPYSNPNNYQHVGRRLAEQLRTSEKNGVIFADQWNNPDNRKAHYVSTGPEIWAQCNGRIDGFICSMGTGGTLAGVSLFLREKKNDIVIGLADPRGAAMYNLFARGEPTASQGSSITEGIGLGRVTPIIEGLKVEKPYLISDEEALPIVFGLMAQEGLCVGGSSGINVAGAIRLAKELGPGHTIVTVLADSGTRYHSKLFNPDFLRSKKLPVPDWLTQHPQIEPPFVNS